MKQKPNQIKVTSKTDEKEKNTWIPMVTAVIGVICIVLVSVAIALSMRSVTSQQNMRNATAQNLQLREQRDDLERRTQELSRERDRLNWTIGVILQYQTFPVNTHCPNKVCRTCLRGWILFQSSCYWFSKSAKMWQKGRELCEGKGADLVVIESLEEQEFINNHTEVYDDDENQGYWIGLSNVKGTWTWVDGSNVTLKYWTAGHDDTGSCALSLPHADKLANWKKSSCYMLNGRICETRALNKPD